MAKKNKKNDSLDVNKDEIIEEEKEVQVLNKESDDKSDLPFYKRYRIPILSSIVKVKEKYFLEDKKTFYLLTSLIIFALIVSITLIVCGALWLSGAFGGNTNNTENSLWPGLLMAMGVCIWVVV